MSRGRWVKWGNRLVPRSVVEPDFDPDRYLPGLCPRCGGAGMVAETLDEEQFDVACACPQCQMFCHACNAWVKREGHTCEEKT